MHLKLLTSLAACFVTATVVCARDGHGDGQQSQDDIQGTDSYEAHIVFTATADAPPCAIGTAHLEAENEDGTVTASLRAHFGGLPAGDYVLTAVRISDGSSETLAQLSLGAAGDNPGGDDGQEGDQGTGQWGGSGHGEGQGTWGAQWQWCGDTNCAGTFEARLEMQIPADLDVTDIGQLVLSDTNGTALLVGDATGASSNSSLQVTASVRLALAPGAAHVHGKAMLHATVHNGRSAAHVSVLLSGVAPNALYKLQINGRQTAQARSGPHGGLTFQPHTNAAKVHTVNVVDAHGRALAHGHF